MFKFQLKFQSTALLTIVIHISPRNHKCQYFTYLGKYPGGNTANGWMALYYAERAQ